MNRGKTTCEIDVDHYVMTTNIIVEIKVSSLSFPWIFGFVKVMETFTKYMSLRDMIKSCSNTSRPEAVVQDREKLSKKIQGMTAPRRWR